MTTFLSPLWRWLLTDLDGVSITLLDKLASDRVVTPRLNAPSTIEGTVPSDSPEVNRIHTDGFPFLAEGVRQLYAFRREEDQPPYYTIRASGLVLQVGDASGSGDARSRLSAFDPWEYLYHLPITFDDDGLTRFVDSSGYLYDSSARGDEIVLNIMSNLFLALAGRTTVLAAQTAFIDLNQAAWESTGTFAPDGYRIEQGQTVGEVLEDLCTTGNMDIVFTPIYDPVFRPGLLAEMNVVVQAGTWRDSAIFAWDMPGRSLVGIDSLYDGTQRANWLLFGKNNYGQLENELAASENLYGVYFDTQYFPLQSLSRPVSDMITNQLELRGYTKHTVTVNPAPERSPEPFVDYYLGDRVPIWASDQLRQAVSGFQRVYGIPVEIDDNGVETVRQLLVGPAGERPAVAGGSGGSASAFASSQAALRISRRRTTYFAIRPFGA